MKLVAAVLAVAALGLPAAQASSSASVPGLVYTPGYGNSIVARYDPLSLARSGPRVRLGGNASSWSWSPQRRYLAIASYPQRLTVIEAATARVVSRTRLAPGGGVTHAVTWAGDRVLAVVETPSGAVVTTVDPLAGRVVRTTRLSRPSAYEFGRLPDGLVLLLGAQDRIATAQVAVVDSEGRTRIVSARPVSAGFVLRAEQRRPGLAVDPVERNAYVVGAEGIVRVNLDKFVVAERAPLRTLAKVFTGSSRSAQWLGNGLLAVSGYDWSETGSGPAGLRIVDVRDWTTHMADRGASSFTVAGRLLLVERAATRSSLGVTAYGFDGRQRYRVDLAGSTWLKKQGRLGYACRDAFLRAVLDLATGSTLRTGVPDGTRCPTLLVDDSRG